MDDISSFNIAASVETLRNGFKSGAVPNALAEPFQSLLPRLTRAAAASPTAVYLFSGDESAETRNLFAYALAAALAQHIPSTILVDCGFLDVGLSGVVPQRDALGFLDLLLYGSSLGVITQETTGGVHVVGAGSFPVTKKMPFVLNAFQEAARRLLAHARCVVFCGPLYDDDGELHPLIAACDVPLLVRAVDGGAGVVDPIEEQLAAQVGTELLSIRINPRPAAGRVATPKAKEATAADRGEAPPSRPEPEFKEIGSDLATTARMESAPPAPERPRQEPPAGVTRETPGVRYDEEASWRGRWEKRASLIPKIATGAVALVVVAFLVWWFFVGRGGGGGAQSGRIAGPVPTPSHTDSAATVEAAVVSAADTSTDTSTGIMPQAEVARQEEPPLGSTPPAQTETGESAPSEQPQSTGAQTPSAGAIDPRNILVMDDLERNWPGYHLIHVSSFRESTKARSEVKSLEARGFPVFIVYIDLGAKGKWYRVYAGPLRSREEAREMKKSLDDTPGVRFTRITQIPS
jgi:cell division septation protein DedD